MTEPFTAELRRWRTVRGVSQSALAKEVGYTPSYISKVESGQQKPSRSFAGSADRVLQAGGALMRAYQDTSTPAAAASHERDQPADTSPTSLLVEHDEATLHYDGSTYTARQRRCIYNASQEPITSYLIRISVDRFPGNPERSNRLYRADPLTWEEIGLHAQIGDEPIGWRVRYDWDAFKELWLNFENEHGRYPLYPGERAWLEYTYTVGDRHWGHWFQRAVRLPTKRLAVLLDFPANLDPTVWGTETTMTAAAFPFRTAIQQDRTDDGRVRFAWATDDPPLHARYRLEWKFRARDDDDTEGGPVAAVSASETMRSLGILQQGDPLLTAPARPFNLPAEAEDARRVVAELSYVAGRVQAAHLFAKGMGLAAPQIGIDRAAAIVRSPDGETITLLNPRVIEESDQADEQYEGCLSFFDVRGSVPRPLAIHVEHQAVDGSRQITVFDQGLARLVGHEIDHLHGVLYTARMRPDVRPIPISEYRRTGQPWQYGS
jgi:peptide deformylase